MSKESSYSIGNHVITVRGNRVVSELEHMGNFFPFRTDKESEWTVEFGCQLKSDDFEVRHSFDFDDNCDMYCKFGIEGRTNVLVMLDRNTERELVRMECDEGDTFVKASEIDEEAIPRLGFLLWFAYNIIGIPRGVMAFHSSTVVYKGMANLFLGESGTGKSTHSKLWIKNIDGARLLNDDGPIVVFENGLLMVYGSPWSGKTHCYHNVGFPAKAFVRIVRAKYNKIQRLSVLKAFAALQPSMPPAMAYVPYYSDKLLDNLEAIIKTVPVYQLECLPDDAAAATSFGELYGKSTSL